MIVREPQSLADPKRSDLRAAYRTDESDCVEALTGRARMSAPEAQATQELAAALVLAVRGGRSRFGGLDSFLQEYGLSNPEGVVLMCMAEALLRIPDAGTADRLIRDKIGGAAWDEHLGQSPSLLVNASTWGLMLTGRVVRLDEGGGGTWRDWLGRLVSHSGEPVIRNALTQAMRIMGHQFVMGRTIGEAMVRGAGDEAAGTLHSFDMLGEAARTIADADRHFAAYLGAIEALGKDGGSGPVTRRPSVSVKLSALHPRFEFAKRDRLAAELAPRMQALAEAARDRNLSLCIDAEEADRLESTMDVFEVLGTDAGLADWQGLGLAVQSYQKRAPALIRWLGELAGRGNRRLMVRLMKGAYWDTEIKVAQEGGYTGYPVFTRKSSTDVSFLACARDLLAMGPAIHPQFATHNAHSVAAVLAFADGRTDFEFQRLHGMGEPLFEHLRSVAPEVPCRVYAPVGSHEDLLPYLVRRLLENGANTSFVNRIYDDELPVARIIADPVADTEALKTLPHPAVPLPPDLYQPERTNAAGIDLEDPLVLAPLKKAMDGAGGGSAGPLVSGTQAGGTPHPVFNPANRGEQVGEVAVAGQGEVLEAIAAAHNAATAWDQTPAGSRADILRAAADAFEAAAPQLMALCVREGGKTLGDSVAEVREAVDFLRFYAAQAEQHFAEPKALPGPTGEHNQIEMRGRGVFACVSPWNFPLAIFTGQIAAALAAGNGVIAKPAGQTPLVAHRAVRLIHEAGVPPEVLHLLPGPGGEVGAALVADERIAGVAFTGSTDTAKSIHRALAARDGAIPALIAETGGVNAMVVDSSALAEQVVADVVRSAFNSAGQRCSALRLLFLQEEVADKTLDMLAGAMAELAVGDPQWLATDVGPMIDGAAKQALLDHLEKMGRDEKILYQTPMGPECESGTFVPPTLVALEDPGTLTREVFGPILHVVRYAGDRLDRVCEAINRTGYGLTLGIHSRVDDTVGEIQRRVRVGNVYVNRTMIGAVVGVQPFGGEGLSGTGPKAGGPHTLLRFATERVLSVNTSAAGGNAALIALAGEEGEE